MAVVTMRQAGRRPPRAVDRQVHRARDARTIPGHRLPGLAPVDGAVRRPARQRLRGARPGRHRPGGPPGPCRARPGNAAAGSRDRAALHGGFGGGRRRSACGVRRGDGCVAARVAVRHWSGHARGRPCADRVPARPPERCGEADAGAAARPRRDPARPRAARRQERRGQRSPGARASPVPDAARCLDVRTRRRHRPLPVGPRGRDRRRVDEGRRLSTGGPGCGRRQRRVRRRRGSRARSDAHPHRDPGRGHCAEAGGSAGRERGPGEAETRRELAQRTFDAQRRPQHRVDLRPGRDARRLRGHGGGARRARAGTWPPCSTRPAASITTCRSPAAATASRLNRRPAWSWCSPAVPATGRSFSIRRAAWRLAGSPPTPAGISTATAHSARTAPSSTCRRIGSRTAAGSSGCGRPCPTGVASTSGRATGWVRTRFGCSTEARGSRSPTAGSVLIRTPVARS